MEDNLQIGDTVKVIDINAVGNIISINEKGLFKVVFNSLYIPAWYKSTELKFIERNVKEEI